MEGGGGYPTSKWQSHLNAITQPGNKMIGLVGSPSTIILYSLLYLNTLITCLILSICPPSGHVSSNYIHLDKQGHTRQNKPLPHFLIIKYFATFLFRPPPHLLTLHTRIFDKLYQLWYCWIENSSSFNMIPNMINIILALLNYYRSNSSFLTFCAGYRSHYVCNDVSIWFAYKWSKMLTKKLAPCLKRFSIFQLTKCHQKTSVFTKCPRDPQKWTIAPVLSFTFNLFTTIHSIS